MTILRVGADASFPKLMLRATCRRFLSPHGRSTYQASTAPAEQEHMLPRDRSSLSTLRYRRGFVDLRDIVPITCVNGEFWRGYQVADESLKVDATTLFHFAIRTFTPSAYEHRMPADSPIITSMNNASHFGLRFTSYFCHFSPLTMPSPTQKLRMSKMASCRSMFSLHFYQQCLAELLPLLYRNSERVYSISSSKLFSIFLRSSNAILKINANLKHEADYC